MTTIQPGVYWCARDLGQDYKELNKITETWKIWEWNIIDAATEIVTNMKSVVGNHHFILIVDTKENLEAWDLVDWSANADTAHQEPKYEMADGKPVYFCTLGGFVDDTRGPDSVGDALKGNLAVGSLVCHLNDDGDVFAVREHIDPEKYIKPAVPDFDLELRFVGGPSALARSMARLVKIYRVNTKNDKPTYKLSDTNCAAWVNTLMGLAGISQEKRVELGEMKGLDWGEEEEVDASWFTPKGSLTIVELSNTTYTATNEYETVSETLGPTKTLTLPTFAGERWFLTHDFLREFYVEGTDDEHTYQLTLTLEFNNFTSETYIVSSDNVSQEIYPGQQLVKFPTRVDQRWTITSRDSERVTSYVATTERRQSYDIKVASTVWFTNRTGEVLKISRDGGATWLKMPIYRGDDNGALGTQEGEVWTVASDVSDLRRTYTATADERQVFEVFKQTVHFTNATTQPATLKSFLGVIPGNVLEPGATSAPLLAPPYFEWYFTLADGTIERVMTRDEPEQTIVLRGLGYHVTFTNEGSDTYSVKSARGFVYTLSPKSNERVETEPGEVWEFRNARTGRHTHYVATYAPEQKVTPYGQMIRFQNNTTESVKVIDQDGGVELLDAQSGSSTTRLTHTGDIWTFVGEKSGRVQKYTATTGEGQGANITLS